MGECTCVHSRTFGMQEWITVQFFCRGHQLVYMFLRGVMRLMDVLWIDNPMSFSNTLPCKWLYASNSTNCNWKSHAILCQQCVPVSASACWTLELAYAIATVVGTAGMRLLQKYVAQIGGEMKSHTVMSICILWTIWTCKNNDFTWVVCIHLFYCFSSSIIAFIHWINCATNFEHHLAQNW